MRISDWSSDVCSSDLPEILEAVNETTRAERASSNIANQRPAFEVAKCNARGGNMGGPYHAGVFAFANICEIERRREQQRHPGNRSPSSTTLRSEEHTSELQSLMRTSHYVFCLTKKYNSAINPKTQTQTIAPH